MGVKSVIQPFSQLDPGAVWAGSPALCLDPGLGGEDVGGGKGTLRKKQASSRWQRSQKHLATHPRSMVLSSRGLMQMQSVRLSEGMSGPLGSIREEEEEEEEDFGPVQRGSLSVFRQRVLSVVKGPTANRSRTNTFIRRDVTAFSQATMIVEELQEVKHSGLDYGRMALLVPCVLVPAWIMAALTVPLYILQAASMTGDAYRLIPLAATVYGKAFYSCPE